MLDVMGIINSNDFSDNLGILSRHRCTAAVLFGARYRLIDFPLSNMVNSGIRNVGVISSYKYRPLMDHLGAGKHWFLDRKAEGLFLLPGRLQSIRNCSLRFDLNDLYVNADYLRNSTQRTVILSRSNIVCNFNYKDVIDYHRRKDADITMIYKKLNAETEDLSGRISFNIDNLSRVFDIQENTSGYGTTNLFIESMIIEKSLLLEILENCKYTGKWDLFDIIEENSEELRVYAYRFQGYTGRIYSTSDYYRCSMELLNPDIRKELFMAKDIIFTKVKDNPPTRYGFTSKIKNTLIGSGCFLNGEVEDSIIFRGVTIQEGAVVKNSIIMQNCIIGPNVVLENAILDKSIVMQEGTVLKGNPVFPTVVEKEIII